MNKTPPVVVLRGNDICFLGIIRSLGKAGIPFVTITFTWDSAKPWWSESSRYFVRDYTIGNPFTSPKKALEQIENVGRKLLDEWSKPLLVIPSSDTNLMLFLDNEEKLSAYFSLMGEKAFSSYRSDVAHKFECAQLLDSDSAGLSPKSLRCRSAEDIERVLEKVDYPVVFKPAVKDYGQSFYAKYNGLKAVNCDNENELRSGLIECVNEGFDVIVQEKILFDRVEDEIPFYAYVDEFQNIRIAATGVKEVIQPSPFGTANVLRLSWHPELLEVASKVVRLLKWRGIIMIEFIRDKKDNKWKVIEINIRPWLFIGFYDRFGLRYLQTLYEDWCHGLQAYSGTTVPAARIADRCPLHVDLYNVAANLKESDRSTVFESTETLLDWLRQWGELITTTYYDHDDAMPAMMGLPQLRELTGLEGHDVIEGVFTNLTDPADIGTLVNVVYQ